MSVAVVVVFVTVRMAMAMVVIVAVSKFASVRLSVDAQYQCSFGVFVLVKMFEQFFVRGSEP